MMAGARPRTHDDGLGKPSFLRGLLAVLGLNFRADRGGSVMAVVLMAGDGLQIPLQAYALKLVVDAVIDGDTGKVLAGVAMFAGSSLLGRVTDIYGHTVRFRMQAKATFLIDQRIMELVGAVPGLDHYERPEYRDQLTVLRNERNALAGAVNMLLLHLSGVAMVIGAVVSLVTIHPAMALLIVVGVPTITVGKRAAARTQQLQQDLAESKRLQDHLYRLGTSAPPAKELRLFALGDEVLRRHHELWTHQLRVNARNQLRVGVTQGLAWAVLGVGYLGAMVFIGNKAINGDATPGDVLLAFTLGTRVLSQWQVRRGFDVSYLLQTIGRFSWLMDYSRRAAARSVGDLAAPDGLSSGITLEGVSFRYASSDTDALENVDLVLPAGTTVAIVGENGAGKTTLVKLLARLYEPTSGRITVDGDDLARIAPDLWRERVSGAFQDFARFEFVARESVGVGDLARIDDVESLGRALDRAASADLPDSLPGGLETQLGRRFEGGVDLSGGQWQKVAVARAMMRERPLLLILDEPTAALDAPTEHALFERYAAAARDASVASGGVTVLVSHRFSTVRMADLIVVLDRGRVVEFGSHSSLMSRGGQYAELFELQARAYR